MRRFKTVIEITAEAEDKNEALDIAGEYLRGTLSSGISMKCATRPVYNYRRIGVLTFFALCIISTAVLSYNSISTGQNCQGQQGLTNACQPILQTSIARDKDFKERWQEKNIERAIEHIKE